MKGCACALLVTLEAQKDRLNVAGFHASEHIDRPPEDVFAYITNLDNALEWLPAVTHLEQITQGPLSVGTRYRETRQVGDREGQVEMEVTEYDPPRRYAVAFARGGYESTYRYTFEAESSGTRAELACVVSGRGLKRLTAHIVARAMKRFDEGQLASLKAAIEGGG